MSLVRPWLRAVLVLSALGWYGYGDHVADERAFRLRLGRVPWRATGGPAVWA